MGFLIKEMNLTTSFLVLLLLGHRSLVKNKKETAVINIELAHVSYVTVHTFQK